MSEESACRGRSVEAVRQRVSSKPATSSRRAARSITTATLSLAELQTLFQRAVIDGDDEVLDLIADNSRTDRETLFGVYRYAYRARLVEVLRNDYAELTTLIADDDFEGLALGYIEAHPSRTQNARWFGAAFPEFLAAQADHPERAELALLIRALNDAFDAADGTRLTLADLAAVPPGLWGGLVFSAHPAVRRIDLATNATALWRWVRDGGDATTRPEVMRLSEPEQLAVYRPELTPRFRALSYEEAMMFDEMAKGVAFAGLCEFVGTYGGEDGAALRAASHLKLWIEEGMLSGPEAD